MYLFFITENTSNGDYMIKKVTIISILLVSMLLVSLFVISSTYSVLVNVISRDGYEDIIESLTIRDILTDSDGGYNSLYYDIKNELNISYEEGEVLIESVLLNNVLEELVRDVVNYKIHDEERMDDSDIYNLIVSNVRMDNNISDEVKEKVINKTGIYINDIVHYIYDFDIGVLS